MMMSPNMIATMLSCEFIVSRIPNLTRQTQTESNRM